jgi:hypothetical protein
MIVKIQIPLQCWVMIGRTSVRRNKSLIHALQFGSKKNKPKHTTCGKNKKQLIAELLYLLYKLFILYLLT